MIGLKSAVNVEVASERGQRLVPTPANPVAGSSNTEQTARFWNTTSVAIGVGVGIASIPFIRSVSSNAGSRSQPSKDPVSEAPTPETKTS